MYKYDLQFYRILYVYLFLILSLTTWFENLNSKHFTSIKQSQFIFPLHYKKKKKKKNPSHHMSQI